MRNQLELFLWTPDNDLREHLELCLQLTWKAGLAGRALISPHVQTTISKEIGRAEVFVCLCSFPTTSVFEECTAALEKGKTILLYLFNDSTSATHRCEEILAEASPGSSMTRIPTKDFHALGTEYLLSLCRLNIASGKSILGFSSDGPEGEQGNRFFERLLHRMAHWPIAYRRYEQNASLKQAAANFFLDQYLFLLANSVGRIFFESGSSIAHLSDAFIIRLEEEWLRMSASAIIETNNILTYLEMVVAQFLPVTLFPAGPPERKYGATLGPLASVEIRAQDADPLGGEARHMVNRIRDHFVEEYSDIGIIFGAVSGIEMRHDSPGFGPHVAGFHQMLFKRSLLEAGCPLVLFLDQHKLPRPYIPGRCYAVCDADLSWEDVCHNQPLALACAFRDEGSAQPVMEDLRLLGFDFSPERRNEQPWCFIATNAPFREATASWKAIADARVLGPKGISRDRTNVRALQV